MAGVARFSIRFRYAIIGGWLIAAALCVTLLPSLASAINTDNSSFLPASAPSQQAMDLAEPFHRRAPRPPPWSWWESPR